MKYRDFFLKTTFAALFVLSLGIFTSISFMALSHILLGVSGIYFLIHFFQKRDLEIPLRIWGLLAVWGTCILSVVFNWSSLDNPWFHALKTKYFFIGIISYFAFQYCINEYLTPRKIRILLNMFFISANVASISGIIALFSGFHPLRFEEACHPTRVCGLSGMLMTYAYGLSFFMIIAVGLLIYRKEIKECLNLKLLVGALIINGAGLFLSYARGAWLGVLLGIPFFFFKKQKRFFAMALLAVGIFLGGVLFFHQTSREAFFLRFNSDSQRLALFETAFKAFQEKPVFGYGYRNFEPNVISIKARYDLPAKDHPGHAHNNFLEHLASTGALGGLAFLLFSLFWILDSYRREDVVGKISFPLAVSFSVSGMVQYTFGDGEILFFLMLVLGL